MSAANKDVQILILSFMRDVHIYERHAFINEAKMAELKFLTTVGKSSKIRIFPLHIQPIC